jgi:hypothetical protein
MLTAILLLALIFLAMFGLIDHLFNISWSNGAPPIFGNQTRSDNGEVNFDDTVAASQTDFSIPATFDKDRINSIFIIADFDCTLETNSGSSPANTIALKAGIPVIWFKEYPAATNPFAAADVTGFFFTTGANPTRLRIRILWDITP